MKITKRILSIFQILLFFALSMAFLSGCARPMAKNKIRNEIRLETKSKDAVVNTQKAATLKIQNLEGRVRSSDLFRFLNNVPAQYAQQAVFRYYSSLATHTRVSFKDSPYADFIVAKSKPEFLKATEGLPQFFGEQTLLVKNCIDQVASRFNFPRENISIAQALDSVALFLTQFEDQLKRAKVHQGVRSGIISGIYQRFWLKLPAATKIVRELEGASDFGSAMDTLRKLIRTMDVELGEDQARKIEMADSISDSMNDGMSTHDAFIVLVELWDNMNPSEREETFGEISPELYKYLESKSRKHLNCLKSKECSNLVLNFTKKIFILPNIKKYGVDRLQSQIKKSAHERLRSETHVIASELVASLPQMLKDEISGEMNRELERFIGYRSHYDKFVRDEMQSWFERTYLEDTLPALEKNWVLLSKVKSGWSFLSEEPAGVTEVSADAMGSALALSDVVFDPGRQEQMLNEMQLLAMTRVNQLLAHGGFSLDDGRPFLSLSRSLFPRIESAPLNIEKGLHLPSLFAMPSPAQVDSGFKIPSGTVPQDLKVQTQAYLLSGFTHLISAFRDWGRSSMDGILGSIRVRDMLRSLPADDLKMAAFPKEVFVAMAVGNASAVLANFRAKGSPLFILCEGDRPNWGDEEALCEKPSALAAIVDIQNRKRVMNVNALSQAEFLSSLIDFLSVGAEALKTQSPHLLRASVVGEKSGLEELKEALPEIRKLALGLTNFLTHKLQNEEGTVYDAYRVKETKTLKHDSAKVTPLKVADVRTHLAFIRAVSKSAEYFNLNVYRLSALSAYHNLNRNFWNEKVGFYSQNPSSTVKETDVLEAIRVLRRVVPYIQENWSKEQLEQLLSGWSAAALRHVAI